MEGAELNTMYYSLYTVTVHATLTVSGLIFIWILLTRFFNSNILHYIIHLFSVLKQAINSVTTNVILLKFMRSVKTK